MTLPEKRNISQIQYIFRFAIAAFALIVCWVTRFVVNTDATSYLDIGDQYWKGDWHIALNPYWSPLYSLMTGLVLRLTKPSIRWEYPSIQLLNLLVLMATLLCFEFFWRELLNLRNNSSGIELPLRYGWLLGYLIFIYMHFCIFPQYCINPDLMVAAITYLVFAMMLRFARGINGVISAGIFGVLLGIGYLAKAAMLPFGFIMLLTMLAVAWKRRGSWRLATVSLLCFLAVSLPFIVAISIKFHRFAFGDAGKLNVASYVNAEIPRGEAPKLAHWQGNELFHPLHPTRKLLDWPEVYEFATPIAGTYPVSYDPTYWRAGTDTQMHPKHEIVAFLKNLVNIAQDNLSNHRLVIVAIMILVLLSDKGIDIWRNLKRFWPVIVPSVLYIMMYMLVLWEPRYTCAETVALWGVLAVSTSIGMNEWRIKVLRAVSLTLGLMIAVSLHHAYAEGHDDNCRWAEQVVVAEQLKTWGMVSGDSVALIGDGSDESWARLEKVKIIAEVPHVLAPADSAAAFWNSGKEEQQKVLILLHNIGAKAVVAETPPAVLPNGWVHIAGTGHAVYFFR